MLSSRTFVPIGKSVHPTEKSGVITSVDPEEPIFGEDSGEGRKTMYVNDSTNLDTLPFDTIPIVGEMEEEDIE
jgi:hypothetical protein